VCALPASPSRQGTTRRGAQTRHAQDRSGNEAVGMVSQLDRPRSGPHGHAHQDALESLDLRRPAVDPGPPSGVPGLGDDQPAAGGSLEGDPPFAGHPLLDPCLSTFQTDQGERPGAFPLTLAPIDLAAGARAFSSGGLTVSTTPNRHGPMPNFAVRVDAAGAGSLVYSSDTMPCDAVAALARGARTLVHEASYLERDRDPAHAVAHSTAAEAGEIAARAGVERLILTHVGAEYHGEAGAVTAEARGRFGGAVEVAEELRFYFF